MTTSVLRCTRKLLRLLGSPDQDAARTGDDHTEWYANLIWLDRRKCVLFTHAQTLFSFLAPDVTKSGLVPIGEFFIARLGSELRIEGLPADVFGGLDASSVRVTRTDSRSFLGSINDLAGFCRHVTLEEGGLARVDIVALNRRLRRTPLGAIGYRYPMDLLED